MSTATQKYHQVSARNSRDELILEHLPLVRHVVSRLVAQLPTGTDVENLEAAGMLGLVEAAGKFDPERGVHFKTFAQTRIRGEVLDELRRNCPIPQHLLERSARVRQAYKDAPLPVTLENLAETTGLSAEEISDCLAALRLTRMTSLDELSDPARNQVPQREDGPDAQAEFAEQKKLLAQAITQLPERERLVITLYYQEDLRLKEIGQVLHLSESRVSRLLQSALFHLGESLRS